MTQDRLGHLDQGAAALLDGFDQPLGGLNLALEKLLGLRVRLLIAIQLEIPPADVKARHPIVEQLHVIITRFRAFDDNVGHDIRHIFGSERPARLRIQVLKRLDAIVDRAKLKAGFFLDCRQTVVLMSSR